MERSRHAPGRQGRSHIEVLAGDRLHGAEDLREGPVRDVPFVPRYRDDSAALPVPEHVMRPAGPGQKEALAIERPDEPASFASTVMASRSGREHVAGGL